MQLSIKQFAQIRHAEIDFGKPGDLTLLVGQQATGKSLVLQWLKLMCDRPKIREDWNRYGANWRVASEPLRELDVFFGEGLGAGYDIKQTQIELDGKRFSLAPKNRSDQEATESVYFIPAQRALLMADGWPRPFSSYVQGTPYVARAQSERLVQWLGNGQETIFPISRKLPESLRNRFEQTIFHGASVQADRQSTQSRMLLNIKSQGGSGHKTRIPYMAWTAGQREFVPLLMALYRLLPSSAMTKDPEIHTVVIEEPELGLHPKAVFALGHAVLRLMERGYRVAVSTHSPLMIDFAWTLRRLKKLQGSAKSNSKSKSNSHSKSNTKPWRDALEINSGLATKLMDSTVRTYYMAYAKTSGYVVAQDISELRTNSDDPAEAAWGLMQEDAMRMADIVSQMNLNFQEVA
jgi:hypothetical protein